MSPFLVQIQTQKEHVRATQNYLRCEEALSSFFTKFNYCGPNCVTQQQSMYGRDGPERLRTPGIVACCAQWGLEHRETTTIGKSVGGEHLLRERQAEYGSLLPTGSREPCGYHTSRGCKLSTHKPATCVSYACPSFVDALHSRHNIKLDWQGIEHFLEDVLNGRSTTRAVDTFVHRIAAAEQLFMKRRSSDEVILSYAFAQTQGVSEQ